jgi:predicted permease
MKRWVGLFPLLAAESGRALRRLARTPLFVAVAVLTLGMALAPSLIFELVGRAVLPPLPYEDSEELVLIWQSGEIRRATSYPKLRLLQDETRSMDVAPFRGGTAFLSHAGESVALQVCPVDPAFFRVLRVGPALGRTFLEEENVHPLKHPVAVISDELWRERFDGDEAVLGESLELNGTLLTVIGVMPPGFRTAWWSWRGDVDAPDVWVPAMMAPIGMHAGDWRETARALEDPNIFAWVAIGRLRPGYRLSDARAEATAIGARVRALWPEFSRDYPESFELVPMSEEAADPAVLDAVRLLKVAGSLVFLLGGLNLGHLLLARSLERLPAHHLHAVLGAPRAALMWGLVAEALVVGLTGSLVGVALTRGSLATLALAEPTVLTAPFGVTFDAAAWHQDPRLLAGAIGAGLLAAAIFSVWPAWRSTRVQGHPSLRSAPSVTRGGLRALRLMRPQGLLVAVETTAALAVLFPALLLVRSLDVLVGADLGFEPRGVTTAHLHLPASEAPLSSPVAFVGEALDRLRRTPAIEAAAWTSCLPIECETFQTSLLVTQPDQREGPVATVHVVSPASFRTLGIRLQRGRDFDHTDSGGAPKVAILGESAATALGIGAPGQRVHLAAFGNAPREVVGIVGDVPHRDLAREQLPAVYLPLPQEPRAEGFLVVRAPATPGGVADLLRRTVASLDPSLEPPHVETLTARIDRAVSRFRGAAWLLAVAAGLALFLCAVGIYGVLWSLVVHSLPEIGIRIALGASPSSVALSLSASVLRLAGVGLLVGGALGAWGASHLDGYLYRVTPWDSHAVLGILVIAAAVAQLAALRPAIRASRTDPIAALRAE